MKSYDAIIVGGGAAGLVAAITAKHRGKKVLLCEKMPRLGKKLLVTGAGRCNLLNEKLDESFYNAEARPRVKAVLEAYGKIQILNFFKDLGLQVYADETGRIFPVTNQAASVLKVLELEAGRLEIPVRLTCEVRDLRVSAETFEIRTAKEERFSSGKVILCAGGKSYPALGADGGSYVLAEKLGHTVLQPVPCVVPLLAKDPWCHFLQGQKVRAKVTASVSGKITGEAAGELLFTQYGLSGTAVLDISREISIAINRHGMKTVMVMADFVPWMNETELERELARKTAKGFPCEALLEGILPHKFSAALKEILLKRDLSLLVKNLKQREFKIIGTRGWNESEFTAGGVPSEEVHPRTLESLKQKGLFLAGEVLDVQGARGGYNLAWAWASGAVTGASV